MKTHLQEQELCDTGDFNDINDDVRADMPNEITRVVDFSEHEQLGQQRFSKR